MKTDKWKKLAKEAWPDLSAVKPLSFAKYKGQIHIVVDGVVIVLEGKDVDTLRTLI